VGNYWGFALYKELERWEYLESLAALAGGRGYWGASRVCHRALAFDPGLAT
tara:strand:- start:924 stop:1076 length:153 start_codon:yes stop_codon:yes gene_type:complete